MLSLKSASIILIIVALVALSLASAEQVESVHDGDTFRLVNGPSVRLSGIDAPEIGQPYSIEARDYLQRLVNGRDVSLVCTGKSFKRKVCKASVVGLDIQKEMVGWGLAYDSPKYSKGEFLTAEKFAQKMNRGVWQLDGGGVRPWTFRNTKKNTQRKSIIKKENKT